MESISKNENDDDNADINTELYQQLLTGHVSGFNRTVTSKQVNVLELRCTRNKSTVLHITSASGHVDLVNNILSRWPELIVQGNSQGDLPIHSALKTCKMNVVDALTCWLQKQRKVIGNDVSVNQVLGWKNVEGNTALHIALEYEKEQGMARELVDLYPPASYAMNNEGICPLYLAIKKNLSDLVQHMLQKLHPFKEDALSCLTKGHSVLHAAVSTQKIEMLEHLLSYDDRKLIYLVDKEGWTALSYAACKGYWEKVHFFHTRVVDSAFISNKDKSFPIHWAVLEGHLSVISLLTSSRFLLNARGQNILHLATSTGGSELVSHVLNLSDVDSLINQHDDDGNTPLHLATLAKHVEVVEILIQNEWINVGLSNKEGLTANDLAKELTFVDDADEKVVQRLNWMLERATSDIQWFPIDGKLYLLLVNRELDQISQIVSVRRLQLKDLLSPEDGSNVLHISACVDNLMLIFDLLVKHNCATLMYQANKKGDLPIHSAAKAGKLSSLEALFLWSKVHVCRVCERRNMDGNTALHVAMLNNQREIANYLYKLCPQTAYFLNKDNICPLFLAIKDWSSSENDLINTMIEGLKGNAQLQNHVKGAESVVHKAIQAKSRAILDSIIDSAPCLLDTTDNSGRNPLSYAACIGYVEGVKLLLKKCPELEFKRDEDEDRSFAIHQAAKRGKTKFIELFCLQVCLLNGKGQNILHVAADNDSYGTVKYLLNLPKFKELLNVGDDNGNTPLHLAVKNFRLNALVRLVEQEHINGNSINKGLLTARDIYHNHLDQYQDEKGCPSSLQIHLMDVMLKKINGKKSLLREERDDMEVKNKKEEIQQVNASEYSGSSPKGSARKDGASTLLVVATLIITVTFAVAFCPPGGYDEHTGKPVLLFKKKFLWFINCDSLALVLAIASAVILILGMNVKGLTEISLYFGGYYIIGGLGLMIEAFTSALILYDAKDEYKTSKMVVKEFSNGKLISWVLLLLAPPMSIWACSKFRGVSTLYVRMLLTFQYFFGR